MVQRIQKKYKSITDGQIQELTSIYDDLLFVTRQHENVLHFDHPIDLAGYQIESMILGKSGFPWDIKPITDQEKKEFHDFIKDDISEDKTRTYIMLQHVNSNEDTRLPKKRFAVPPYEMQTLNMLMPSKLERFTVAYPGDVTVGNTVFYIDGLFKATFINEKSKDMSVEKFIRTKNIQTELIMMINLIEILVQNTNLSLEDYEKYCINVYADEMVIINENIILELIGAFAEKFLAICRDIYGEKKNRFAAEAAQKEGLIQSADIFKECMNIRNYIRHQWDTLDEFGYFNSEKADYIKNKRKERVESYLKLCNKTRIQRMKSYVDILHQMQHVINQINPNRIIRYNSETNNKFKNRLKAAYQCKQDFEVELNYPFADDKYKSLNRDIHKLFPNMRIIDDYTDQPDRKAQIDEYVARNGYLQSFLSVECMVMRHCQIRGEDKGNVEAWEYMKEIGILSEEEAQRWWKYYNLRRCLSHNYFSTDLRKQLFDTKNSFMQDDKILKERLVEKGPDVKKLGEGIFEYLHNDGLKVVLDYNNHRVVDKRFLNAPQTETFQGGVEITVKGKELSNVKLPNGIYIYFDTKSIKWDTRTRWNFNTLQTAKSEIVVDNNFRVVKYSEQNRKISISGGDCKLVDTRHNLVFDSRCRIKEFKFRDWNNNVLKTCFSYPYGGCTLAFPDGTIVYLSGDEIVVSHNGKKLNFDNRAEFAATYVNLQNTLQQNMIKNNGR